MAGSSPSGGKDEARLEPWRAFFRGADIFNVIVHAVLVAATDLPQEFRRRRDSIVEQIYRAPVVVPTLGRDAGEVPGSVRHVSENGGNVAARSCKGGPPDEPEGSSDAKEAADRGDGDNANVYSEMGMDWLHELVDEMDETSRETQEVLRIKDILVNHHEQSAGILFESLRRLQLMQLTVDKLMSTGIGVAVAALRKHKSHKIRKLVLDIAKDWKIVADEWIAATKAAMADKSLDKSNPSAAEDGGLAVPPMDEGFVLSQAAAIQHVSEFLDGLDDDGGIMNNHVTSMDKEEGLQSKRKYNGPRPSIRVAETKEPAIVQALSLTEGSTFRKRNPQGCSRGAGNDLVRQGLEAREGQPLLLERNPRKLLNADETAVHKTKVVLPARQEPVLPATNLQKHQDPGRRLPRIIIKYKPSKTEGEPRGLSKDIPEAPHEDVEQRQNPGKVTVARNPPTAASREPLFGHVTKTGTPAQSLAGPKVGLGKRKNNSDDIGLKRTKRMLRDAYQEAESSKRKRTVRVMEPHDVPKPMGRSPPSKSRQPISRNQLTTSKVYTSKR